MNELYFLPEMLEMYEMLRALEMLEIVELLELLEMHIILFLRGALRLITR